MFFFKDFRGMFALRSQSLKKQALGALEGRVKLVKPKIKHMLQNCTSQVLIIEASTSLDFDCVACVNLPGQN